MQQPNTWNISCACYLEKSMTKHISANRRAYWRKRACSASLRPAADPIVGGLKQSILLGARRQLGRWDCADGARARPQHRPHSHQTVCPYAIGGPDRGIIERHRIF